jgi:hypothetical protein
MAVPTIEDVAAFAGRSSTTGIESHLGGAIALVRSYTRGIGFADYPDDLPDDIAAVIVSLAARAFDNPSAVRSLSIPEAVGTVYAITGGLSWLERVTLARYRRRTA